MFKLSTVLRLFKAIRILAVLALLSFFTGFGPSQIFGAIKSRISLGSKSPDTAVAEVSATKIPVAVVSDDDLCLPMGERDRKQLQKASGADVIQFLEKATFDLHSANVAEEQLKIMAKSFDHQTWSKAWIGSGANSAFKPYEAANASDIASDDSVLQTNLSHASMVLTRYNRLLENGRRQETSALKAFHWQEEVRQEINHAPVRILVQSYASYSCSRSDVNYYGCALGEPIYRVKALMSPRIACRFKDKREQYQVVYWIRVKDKVPKILEVDAKGHRLVKVTYDELVHRELLSVLSPNVGEVLTTAGLDPFRAVVIWRQLNRAPAQGRDPAALPNAGAAVVLPETQMEKTPEASPEAFQSDSY